MLVTDVGAHSGDELFQEMTSKTSNFESRPNRLPDRNLILVTPCKAFFDKQYKQ
jgi:hypothetical protein